MRLIGKLAFSALCVPLAACGGGGGVASTPGPAPSPAPAPAPSPTPTPAPTATPIGNLQSNQTFTGDATTTNVVLGAGDGIVGSTAAATTPLTITYDAATQTYAVEADGRTQSFTPADAQPQRWDGERRYAKATSDGGEFLTLVTNPYSDPQYSNKYVGMGYWQRNALQGSGQQTYFSTFTYGFDTPSAGMPRTGAAHWLTDIFGLLTVPSEELRVVQATGDFVVDFAAGSFSAFSNLEESTVVTQGGGAGGSLRFTAGGQLGSGNHFSGAMSYFGSYPTPLYGTLTGAFYGPNADEVGATFQATGGGAALTGAFTGQRSDFGGSDSSGTIHNISLTAPIADERLYGIGGSIMWNRDSGSDVYNNLNGAVSYGSSYAAEITKAGMSQISGYTINPAEQVPDSRADFITYQTTMAGDPTTVSMYKIGSSNSELQLTYASFSSKTSSHLDAAVTRYRTDYSVFGTETPADLLGALTGSASYDGIAYGSGEATDRTHYDITGTSHFDVDFSNDSFSGWLQLRGSDQSGHSSDFGQWTFGRPDGVVGHVDLHGSGASSGGEITTDFFGPAAEELGAGFFLFMPSPSNGGPMVASGAALAKRH